MDQPGVSTSPIMVFNFFSIENSISFVSSDNCTNTNVKQNSVIQISGESVFYASFYRALGL